MFITFYNHDLNFIYGSYTKNSGAVRFCMFLISTIFTPMLKKIRDFLSTHFYFKIYVK